MKNRFRLGLFLLAFLVLPISSLGQPDDNANSQTLSKAEKKARKTNNKLLKKEYYNRLRRITADPRNVELFPQKYINSRVRFKDVFLEDLTRATTGPNGVTYYYVGVRGAKGLKILSYAGGFYVLLDADTTESANWMFDKVEGYRWYNVRGAKANIVGVVKQVNNNSFVLMVQCVEYLTMVRVKMGFSPGCPDFLKKSKQVAQEKSLAYMRRQEFVENLSDAKPEIPPLEYSLAGSNNATLVIKGDLTIAELIKRSNYEPAKRFLKYLRFHTVSFQGSDGATKDIDLEL